MSIVESLLVDLQSGSWVQKYKALNRISALSNNPSEVQDVSRIFVQHSGIEAVLKFLSETHPDRDQFKQAVNTSMTLLLKLIEGDKGRAKILYNSGGLQVLRFTWENVKGKNLKIPRLLMAMTCYKPAQIEILTTEGLSIIHDCLSMRKFGILTKAKEDGRIHLASALIEKEMATETEGVTTRIGESNTIKHLVKALRFCINHRERTMQNEVFMLLRIMAVILETHEPSIEMAEEKRLPELLERIVCSRKFEKGPRVPGILAVVCIELMKDTSSVKKLTAKPTLIRDVSNIHDRISALGYNQIEDGTRCQPYVQAIVDRIGPRESSS